MIASILTVQGFLYTAATLTGVLFAALFYARWQHKRNPHSVPSLLAVHSDVGGVHEKTEAYTHMHTVAGGTKDDRTSKCQTMVNHYYDLATDFYEYGWGQSFHFATRTKGQSFEESILEHEMYLGRKMGLKEGMSVLDVGCGVGGPLRNIARHFGCKITGLNNNDYQIRRGNAKVAHENLSKLAKLEKGDFMKLHYGDKTFDALYQIEATCHAPDRTACYKELLRVAKPGAVMTGYEWGMTDKYDAKNPRHVELKDGIELGNSLPEIDHIDDIVKQMVKAGWELVESSDLAVESEVDWFEPFRPGWSLKGFRTTPFGIWLTGSMVSIMEAVKLAPKGTTKMHDNLVVGAKTLAEAGELGIFTPMLYYKLRKPMK